MNNYIYKLQITFKKQDPVYAAHKKPTIYYRWSLNTQTQK